MVGYNWLMMKAVQINCYGDSGVLEVNEHAPKPSAAKGQVLVEVHAASINPIDWKIRSGYLKEMAPLQFPATLGGDFAGIVIEVGEGVSAFKVGNHVYGQAILLNGGSGSFAQFVAANAANTARKPTSVNFVQAAALPLAGVSAVQALEEHIKLQKGQKILIHGGAGGIGHLALQLAKSLGGYVAVTMSGKDAKFVKSLGANEGIDYGSEAFEKKLEGFDAVFDTVGGEVTNRSFTVLKKGGVLVSMLGQPNPELAKKYEVTAIGQNTRVNAQNLKRLTELADGGKIKVHVDKVLPLEKAREAFDYQEKGYPQGKVVLTNFT